jgi:hypothetical protein
MTNFVMLLVVRDRLCGLVVRELLATDTEARVPFPAIPEKNK